MNVLVDEENTGNFQGLQHILYQINLDSFTNYLKFELHASKGSYIDLSFSNNINTIKTCKFHPGKANLRKTSKRTCILKIYPNQYHLGPNFLGIKTSKNNFSAFQLFFSTFLAEPIQNLPNTHHESFSNFKYFSYSIQNPDCTRLKVSLKPANIKFFSSFEDHYPEFSLNPTEKDPQPDSSLKTLYDQYCPLSYKGLPNSDQFKTFCFDCEDIRDFPKTCYMKLETKDFVQIEIEIQECTQENVIPEELLLKKNFFETIFSDNNGAELSKWEQNCKGLRKNPEFTYGEIDFLGLVPVLEFCGFTHSTIFWDLGCGTGKCLATVALLYPFTQLKGVEYLESLHSQCLKNLSLLNYSSPIQIIFGDLFQTDWSDADILYCSNICFPAALNSALTTKLSQLKSNCKIILLKPLTLSNFLLLSSTQLQMSWGIATIYIFQKITD